MLSFPAREELSLFPFPVQRRKSFLQLSIRVARAFPMWFSRTSLRTVCSLQAGFTTALSLFSKGWFQTGPRDASGTRMLRRLLLWLEAGISVSSDWQGGIKLLNGPNGFWLGLLAIILTIPVTSMACGVNTRLIFEGCIRTLHPVIINPHSLQQHNFIINSCNLEQRYFIMNPRSLQRCNFQQLRAWV